MSLDPIEPKREEALDRRPGVSLFGGSAGAGAGADLSDRGALESSVCMRPSQDEAYNEASQNRVWTIAIELKGFSNIVSSL